LNDNATCCVVCIEMCDAMDNVHAMENAEIVTSYEELVRRHIVSSFLSAALWI